MELSTSWLSLWAQSGKQFLWPWAPGLDTVRRQTGRRVPMLTCCGEPRVPHTDQLVPSPFLEEPLAHSGVTAWSGHSSGQGCGSGPAPQQGVLDCRVPLHCEEAWGREPKLLPTESRCLSGSLRVWEDSLGPGMAQD